MAHRILAAREWSPAMLVFVRLSLLLGIGTHSFLDAFTHKRGWFVERITLLHSPWPVYRILQHAGSVLGLVLILVAIARRQGFRQLPARELLEPRALFLTAALCLAAAVAIVPAWGAVAHLEGFFQLRAFVFRWIVDAMTYMAVAYLIVALGIQLPRLRGDH